ncbi:N-acetylneuraminate synthase/N,N'-diacetyllegionaminate synthase [Evansella caseinilytica]|uniref:N-acetylneuraminate synthase/N,N'-diacetyllegionaminate synthase n=1 Tax=Evansella caseinilytica TaxID=1503961 RepID=A0A1H3HQW2_9BACI|nr:N-acetylneuraminate synthase [Evansella caseinilytica]SDY17916.1 N-acetylneuraminate synthase/N,N'-diacetyllegionaminate synthase [Evansella caseinilytica]
MFSAKNGVYIIAEIGVNHNGSVAAAKKLVDIAADAGADAVKFQSGHPKNTKIKAMPFADYQQSRVKADSSYEMSMGLMLSYEDHVQLKNYCTAKKIEFLSSPFDLPSVDWLEKLGVKMIKIPSGELTNTPLLLKIADQNKPLILSTGMADIGEIAGAVQRLRKVNDKPLAILHCVSLYPTPYEKLNLAFIRTLKAVFPEHIIGFSDHSLGIPAAVAAVALGAKVIEKHLTLDKQLEGPDHQASLAPDEFRELVRSIRFTELALGSPQKMLSQEELAMRQLSRRSIVTARPINEGEVFTVTNLAVKRPGTGIPPGCLEIILGRKAVQTLSADCILRWEHVGEQKNSR